MINADLQSRLHSIERSYRLLRAMLGCLAIMLVAASTVAMQSSNPKTLTTQRLLIEDQQGRARLVLNGMDDNRGSSITLRDGQGRDRVRVFAPDDDEDNSGMAFMVFLDTTSTARLALQTDTLGYAVLRAFDSEGASRAILGTFPDLSAEMEVYDPEGTKRLGLAADAEGNASFQVNDPASMLRISIASDPAGRAAVQHFDRSGNLRILQEVPDDKSTTTDDDRRVRVAGAPWTWIPPRDWIDDSDGFPGQLLRVKLPPFQGASINVTHSSWEGGRLNDYVPELVKNHSSMFRFYRLLANGNGFVDGREMIWTESRFRIEDQQVRSLSFIFVNGRTAYTVTLMCLADDFESAAAVLRDCVRSIRFAN